MKKILSLVLALLLIGGAAYVVYAASASPSGLLTSPGTGVIMGQGKPVSDPHRTFRIVRWVKSSNVTLGYTVRASADMAVIWDTGTSGDDGVTVTTTNISNDARFAGIIKVNVTPVSDSSAGWLSSQYATEDIGRNNWTWLQTYGMCHVLAADGNATSVVGGKFGTSRKSGRVAPVSYDYNGTGAVSINPASGDNFGFFMDAHTTGTTAVGQIFLRAE